MHGIVIATVASTSDKDDDSVSVAIISGAAVGTLLLLTIIIIITIVIIMCRRRRKCNVDDNNIQLSHLPQQHTDNTSGQSLYHVITIIILCDHNTSCDA